jgi:glutamate---cysteine ligase / carboxylate-amine ligase
MRTFGVEEEVLLVEAHTAAPIPLAREVLAEAARRAPSTFAVVAEMHEEMLELVSRPHASLGRLRAEVLTARRAADDWAARWDARVVPLGTSPLPARPHPTPGGRYNRIVERYGETALRCMTCGLHIHVSIESPDEGVAVLDRIRVWLPVLRALAANSPFHGGTDTGYASYRFVQWSQWPSSGPFEAYGDLDGYRSATRELLDTGALIDDGMLYADARLSNRFPTVEVRVADVPLLVDATATIAGLVRGMVASAATHARTSASAPHVSAAALRLASWTASLEGLGGVLVDPRTGHPAPAAEVVDALLSYAAPGLVEHGDLDAVAAGVDRLLRHGTGADIQRREAAASGSLARMVLAAAEQSRSDTPRALTTGSAVDVA